VLKKIAFYTLGCKVNQYETDSMRTAFMEAGYEVVSFEEPADIYIINTCTVTQVSDKKSRQMIRRAHMRNPAAVIAVVGCYSQRAPEDVLALPGVRLVLGTKERDRIVEFVEKAREEQLTLVSDINQERTFETLPAAQDGVRTRAQLKIQDGCDRYCSYCIIPYARGPVRSRALESVAKEAQHLSRAGYREIVLTGIHLMSYGKDMRNAPITLLDAIDQVAAVSGIERIRLGSLEPAMIDGAFAAHLAEEKKICRQFHLSLQSGSETVLKRMNRRYTPGEYANAVELLRAEMPDCAITTDVIAGFVGETEEEHRETMAFVEKVGFSRIHVFPYSLRTGTKAAQMPGHLPKALKERRAHELIALGERLSRNFLEQQLATRHQVLVETKKQDICCGYTGNYSYVSFEGKNVQPGDIVTVELTQVLEGKAHGVLV